MMGLKKNLNTIIFWGAVWGGIEATLGSLLHAADFKIGWLFWFPLAFYFMSRTAKQTGCKESILLLSVIAAAIKLTDLAFPIRIDKVINPAASILLEGLVVFLAFSLREKHTGLFKTKVFEAALMSFSWRALYAVYVLFLPAWMTAISPVRGIGPFAEFLLLEGTINTLVVFILMKFSGVSKAAEKSGKKKIYTLPVTALASLAFAIFLQLLL